MVLIVPLLKTGIQSASANMVQEDAYLRFILV